MCAPWGLANGKPGATSRNYMRNSGENDFKPFDPTRVLSGPDAAVRVETAGGGGWGSPLDRDPEKVLIDVLDEYVSLESAREDYGVVIDPAAKTVDAKATAALRAAKRAGLDGRTAKAG
jgi:N-methylhydantoinase B